MQGRAHRFLIRPPALRDNRCFSPGGTARRQTVPESDPAAERTATAELGILAGAVSEAHGGQGLAVVTLLPERLRGARAYASMRVCVCTGGTRLFCPRVRAGSGRKLMKGAWV